MCTLTCDYAKAAETLARMGNILTSANDFKRAL